MRRPRSFPRFGKALTLALLLSGCARSGDDGAPAPSGAEGGSTPAAPGDARAFREDGPLGVVGKTGDATQINSLLVAPAEPVGERFVIGFARADGLPADRVGPVRGEFLRDRGIVRLTLPTAIVSTAVTDNAFSTFLADRAFVVRPLGGDSLRVDLHLRSPAAVRLIAMEKPALIVVEMRTGGSPLRASAPMAQRIVVVRPAPGTVSYPIEIEGYARAFEATVVAELRPRGGPPIKAHTTASDWVSLWGEYKLRFDTGPKGPAELFVGEYSAEDGTPEGATFEIDIP